MNKVIEEKKIFSEHSQNLLNFNQKQEHQEKFMVH